MRDDLITWFMDKKRNEADRYDETSIFEYNLAHQTARDTLDDMSLEAPENVYNCGYYRDF
ncbi:MAG: hypothetical protein HC808_18880 [Candidatus Competibacteraceae bacterium]|nr:hypothetical protein [Candidatus Competibacteraceae bacterium]